MSSMPRWATPGHAVELAFAVAIMLGLPLVASAQVAPECQASPGVVSLSGTVRDSTGGGLHPVSVTAYGPVPDDVPSGLARSRAIATRAVRADSGGVYCLKDLPPGGYVVHPRLHRITQWDLRQHEILVELPTPGKAESLDIIYELVSMSLAERARRRALLDSLELARARWIRERPAAYRFQMHLHCFCFGMAAPRPTFEVEGDSVVRLLDMSGELPASSHVLEFWTAHTIDRMFDQIAAEITDPGRSIGELTFDARWGYPVRFSTDGRHGLTDMWRTIGVLRFQALSR